jgi:metallo-beta-lactamase class B
MKMVMKFLLAAMAAAAACFAETPFPPHKIAGNLYYVGSHGDASYLIATPRGHILINPSFEESIPLIETAVSKLGFRFTDIRIILASHAHGDHIAGCALAKEKSKAKVMIMRGDESIVANGGAGDFHYTDARFRPCAVDRVLRDGDRVELGGAVLTAVLTPGHTKGCTTWTMRVDDSGRSLLAVIVGSPNLNPGFRLVNNEHYPEIADDYRRMFDRLASLEANLFLGAHGAYYGLEEKYPRLGRGPNPFIDPAGYRNFVASKKQEFLTKLEAQTKAP